MGWFSKATSWAKKAAKKARRRADELRRRLQREAERARQEAMRRAEQARREAMRRAEQARKEAQRLAEEARRAAERARLAAEKEAARRAAEAERLAAPAVKVASPVVVSVTLEASRRIEKTGKDFRRSSVGRNTMRFTADVAKQTRSIARDAERFGDQAGRVMAREFAKEGLVTEFTQDYVPGGGYVTAIFHAAAGNEDYAQYAAVKGVSTTITAVGATVGSIGGPVTGFALGSASGAAANVWEGEMRKVLKPSVRDKVAPTSLEGVLVAAAVGGALGAGGNVLSGAKKGAGKALSSRASRPGSLVNRASRGVTRPPAGRPRSSAVTKPPPGFTPGAAAGKGGGRKGVAAQLATMAATGYGKRTGIAVAGGFVKEYAKASGAMADLEAGVSVATTKAERPTKKAVAGIAAGVVFIGGAVSVWLDDDDPPPEPDPVALVTTTTRSITTTTRSTTTTTGTTTTTTSLVPPPTLPRPVVIAPPTTRPRPTTTTTSPTTTTTTTTTTTPPTTTTTTTTTPPTTTTTEPEPECPVFADFCPPVG